jgi:hypothetical protein
MPLNPLKGIAVKLRIFIFCKYLVFGLKAHYILAQGNALGYIEKTICALKGQNKNRCLFFNALCCPFRAKTQLLPFYPGRFPGLEYIRLSAF